MCRKIDAEIAELVMGILEYSIDCGSCGEGEELDFKGRCIYCDEFPIVPRLEYYSTDIAAAWTVLEKIGQWLRWSVHGGDIHKTTYYCHIVRHNGMGDFSEWRAEANSAPTAICKAVLKYFDEVSPKD